MKLFNDNEARQINILDERFYQSQKNPEIYYPSVTTILDAYYKGYGFHDWLKQVGYNADTIVEKAAEQGTNVHNMIDLYIKGFKISWVDDEMKQNYTLNEWQMFIKFIEFWETYNPDVLVSEFTMVSDELKIGGTVDFIGVINGDRWLIDFKTSNYIHKTHEIQLAAYATMWNELNPDYKIERTGILWLNALTRGADKSGKKIQGKGWQVKEFDRPIEDAFKLFQHTQAIWNEENPNYKPRNLKYKMEFQRNKDEEDKRKAEKEE